MNNLRVPAEIPPSVFRDVYVFGGAVRTITHATTGPASLAMTSAAPDVDIRADIAFAAVGAVDASGYSAANLGDSTMMAAMIQRADRTACCRPVRSEKTPRLGGFGPNPPIFVRFSDIRAFRRPADAPAEPRMRPATRAAAGSREADERKGSAGVRNGLMLSAMSTALVPPVEVVIPWRDAPTRRAPFALVRRWYETHLPEASVRTIDTDDDVFVLAACRNLAMRTAHPDAVVVIGDADTLPEAEPLRAAISAARTSGRVHLP
ncbi:hypothetical protein GCM10009862_22200 [Microbacterium binotii]|uniref:Uncharacterized protein n=1 Tax=Microbacterium binotii TaxID=462710 RepID=A0ABN3PGP2_9MICO